MFEKELKRLKELQKDDDHENAHIEADLILCNILNELGHAEIVNEFENIKRHYS